MAVDQLDSMGAWAEDSSEAWLPKRFHDRTGAKKLYQGETNCDWIEIRCRSCWVAPDYERPWLGQPGEPTWVEFDPAIGHREGQMEAWALSWVRTPARHA